MFSPLEKVFKKSDLKRTEDLVEILSAHEQTRPKMEARFHEADLKACEISLQFSAATACGSPSVIDLGKELEAACRRRENIWSVWDGERRQIHIQLEALTRDVIKQFHQQCSIWMAGIHSRRRANVAERVYDPTRNGYVLRLANNSRTVQEAKKYVMAAASEVASMQHRPLQEIRKRIGEIEQRLAQFDLEKLDIDEVSGAFEVGDFEAESLAPSAQVETAYLVPAPSQETSGGWQMVKTGQTS